MSDYLLTIAADMDREPDDEQWAIDHPDGEISEEEALAMAEYSAHGRDRTPGHPDAATGAEEDWRTAVWEPAGLGLPKVGDRVRVRLSGECELHDVPDYPLNVDGLVGTVIADTRQLGSVYQNDPAEAERWKELGHHWFVRFGQAVGIWQGQRVNCEDFCTAELIVLDAAPAAPAAGIER